MKKAFLFNLFLLFSISAIANQVTVYNENFSLIRTNINLKLNQGLQDYYYEDIPSTIEPKSVIFSSPNTNLQIFSQNYEYDLANAEQIMQKYINEKVEITTDEEHLFCGILQFSHTSTIGIIEDTTQKLILINREEIRNITLAKLPANFYLKPTLHWQLSAPKKSDYKAELTYLCGGMKWDATYNCVWNPKTKKLQMNSWVTLKNYSGKSFEDVKLNLIARVVKRARHRGQMISSDDSFTRKALAAPEFSEKEFHDFHLYTLDKNISIANKQIKQLQLFPSLLIKAKQKYEYITHSTKIASIISFTNSQKSGLGLALPKGTMKIYQKDDDDNNLEFIGEDFIEHTPIDEEIDITTGNAFDITGKTIIKSSKKISNKIREKTISVLLSNSSKQAKTIDVIHHLSGNWEILSHNLNYEKIDAYRIKFQKKLAANEKFEIIWTERSKY